MQMLALAAAAAIPFTAQAGARHTQLTLQPREPGHYAANPPTAAVGESSGIAGTIRSMLGRAGFDAVLLEEAVRTPTPETVRVDLDLLRQRSPDLFHPGKFGAAIGELRLANASSIELRMGDTLVVHAASRNPLVGTQQVVLGEAQGAGWLLDPGACQTWLPRLIRAFLVVSTDRDLRQVEPWEPTLRALLRRTDRVVLSDGTAHEVRVTFNDTVSLTGAQRAMRQMTNAWGWHGEAGADTSTPSFAGSDAQILLAAQDDGRVVATAKRRPRSDL